jgi:hypothetical protein
MEKEGQYYNEVFDTPEEEAEALRKREESEAKWGPKTGDNAEIPAAPAFDDPYEEAEALDKSIKEREEENQN